MAIFLASGPLCPPTSAHLSCRKHNPEIRQPIHHRVDFGTQCHDVRCTKVRLEVIKTAPAFVNDERIGIVRLPVELVCERAGLSPYSLRPPKTLFRCVSRCQGAHESAR